VIHARAIGHALGWFILALSATLIFHLAFALIARDAGFGPLSIAAGASLLAGFLLLYFCPRPARELSAREALLLVFSIWVGISVIGSLPFYFSAHFRTFTDSFFESASGFTTTGATILADVEVLPGSIQLWRHFTHWIGGMGVVLLGIAILPLVGVGGMQLYRAEFSGAKSERLKPRIKETALAFWKIYVGLTVAEVIALRIAGMTSFEAVCHAFSTLGTGGFSTRTASLAGFNSPAIESIIIVFMLLGGLSFVQHYRLWVEWRPGSVFSDFELRYYFGIAGVAAAIVAVTLALTGDHTWAAAIRHGAFQVSAVMTTTGFVTADWELWHPLCQLTLLTLMFVGGSTGSTAGGLKTSRIVLLWHVVNREFKRMVERRGVFSVRLGGRVVEEHVISGLLSLVYLAFLVNFVACLLLAALGLDVLTAITAVATCMFNVGPGLGQVGPAENYGHLSDLAKWVLTACMIAGRLEFYTVLAIFSPAFWKR
jgi:trk system potassium uptake protein TrkH